MEAALLEWLDEDDVKLLEVDDVGRCEGLFVKCTNCCGDALVVGVFCGCFGVFLIEGVEEGVDGDYAEWSGCCGGWR